MTYRSRYESTFPQLLWCTHLASCSTAVAWRAHGSLDLTPSLWSYLETAASWTARYACRLKDSGGTSFCITQQTTFFLFFARNYIIVSFSHSLHCPLPSPLYCYDSSRGGQGGTWTDRQCLCLFGLFCCRRDICSNTWPLPAVQHKRLFLFKRTIL